MATLRMSILIPRASSPLKVLRIFSKSSRVSPESHRAFHHSKGTGILTAFGPRPRRPAKSANLQSVFTPLGVAAGIRSIFIQTENTPNADVSS